MITLNNFSSKQLYSTEGFKRRLQNVAKQIGISIISYSEIVNITENSIEVLIIDENMYFYKIVLYSNNILNALNSKYEALILNLNLSSDDNILNKIIELGEDYLIDEFRELLSKSLERLTIENSSELNKLEKVTSIDFSISLKNFNYSELSKITLPFVQSTVPNMYKFKIINLDSNSLEFMIITNDCKLFQYKMLLSKDFSRFINRYISSILGKDKAVMFRRNLQNMSFIEALCSTQYNSNSEISKFDPFSFICFLISKFELNTTSIGCGNEGLKNVYKYYLDISSNEAEAKKKIRNDFRNAKTYVDKKSV